MQEVRGHPSRGLPLLVGIRFQVLFHSPHRGAFHLSLTVLCSLSVMYEYLGLEGGPPMFRQDFTCPALLKSLSIIFAYGTVTHYGWPFQTILFTITARLVPVRSPLLGESLLISFPPGT